MDTTAPDHHPKLLEQVREKIEEKHYSYRTEESYVGWIKRFILFHHKNHPAQMGAKEVEAFLSHLAVDRKVSASTQNQAKSALLFLYKEVLEIKLPWLENITQAKTPQRLPVVLTVSEVQSVLPHISGTWWIMANLLYGSGLRLMECVRLRVKDIDFEMKQIVVRDGKGFKDRITMLPDSDRGSTEKSFGRCRRAASP
ncbi:MAG: phage integrase N-terminal SAM-like domain-containing protein [Burkholderiales bacterium]